MISHPLILVPLAEENKTVRRLFANRSYVEAIEHAGGTFLATGRPKDNEDICRLLQLANGLFLMGGHDVCPAFYHEENRNCTVIHRERDELELLLITQAHARKLPILGICRGMQVINVAFGGTLYQDVLKEMPGAIKHDYHFDDKGNELPHNTRVHDVTVEPSSLLYELVGEETAKTNSLHHQGIKALGKNLRAVAHTQDGLIEAIEIEGLSFGLGIEWHPEELGDEISQKIFTAFIEAAKKPIVTSEKTAGVLIPLEAVEKN